jgi:hypothetical protein
MVPLINNAGATLRWFVEDVWAQFGDDYARPCVPLGTRRQRAHGMRPTETHPPRSCQRARCRVAVPPAEIAPSMIAGSDEWAPAPAPACAFPPADDDITMARHRDLAGRFTGHVISGDTCAAGAWLRRLARDPDVSPWLLLDQLTTAQHAVPGLSVRPSGGNWAR